MKQKKLIIAGIVVLAVALIGGIAFGARGGDEVPTTSTTSAPGATDAPTTTQAAVGPVAPLTGLPLADDEIRNRPLLTVKIDNSKEARPQFGLEKADGIVEEKVEGGVSRFMALYHSEDSSQVGPVRSLRTTDSAWLKPEGGMIAYSGGIPTVRNTLTAAGIKDIGGDTFGTKYYKRRGDRPFEHSMWVNTPVLRELTPENATPAKPLYEYLLPGETFGGSTSTPVGTVQGRMAGSAGATTFAWTWDPAQKKFLRTTDGQSHLLEKVGQIAVTNVVLQYVEYRPTQYRDRAGSGVDEAVVTGSYDAWILSDGKMIQAKWNRPGDSDITTFTDSTGAVVKFNRGQTWLSLVPKEVPATPYAS